MQSDADKQYVHRAIEILRFMCTVVLYFYYMAAKCGKLSVRIVSFMEAITKGSSPFSVLNLWHTLKLKLKVIHFRFRFDRSAR